MKKQNGMSLIMLIVVVVLTIAVVGVAALAVRSIVTGEEFLAPIEDFFGVEEDDDDDKEDVKKSDKEDEEDEEDVVDDEEDKDEEDEDKDTTSDKDRDVVHYHGEIDFEDYTNGSELEFSEFIKMNADFYASETEIEKIVFEFDLKTFLEKYYEAYEEEMVASGYDTYESFRDLMMGTFETSFTSGFETSGNLVEDYFKVEFPEKEIMVMTITDEGITNIYGNYGIEEGDSVTEILEGFEEALNIELKEV